MKTASTVVQVEPNIYYIDPLQLGSYSVSGIYLVIGDEITLIEASTSNVAPVVFDAVRSLGLDEHDITRCIVTHVHLDHAGAAGWLVRRLPHLRVYAHERGISHLADPSRLLESAQMVYGSMENIVEIHGEILPVPEKNLEAISGSQMDVGKGIALSVFNAPGHAPHHICVYEATGGCLFSGEALGHYLPEYNVINPAVAPPGFDLEASLETVKKIRRLNPKVICFSQFGQHRDPGFVIEEWERLVRSYGDMILNELKDGLSTGELIDVLMERLSNEPEARDFSEQSLRGMLMSTVLGYYQYYQRTGALG